jgi:hypothetical protein
MKLLAFPTVAVRDGACRNLAELVLRNQSHTVIQKGSTFIASFRSRKSYVFLLFESSLGYSSVRDRAGIVQKRTVVDASSGSVTDNGRYLNHEIGIIVEISRG